MAKGLKDYEYYQTDLGVLYHGDCLSILPLIDKVDLCVTSPPYDDLRDYEGYSFDFEAVANLFISNETTGVDGIAQLIKAEAEALTQEYLADDPGILQVLSHNYDGIIENIDKKIAREERRIAMVENRLNRQFAAFETLLGQLQGQENVLRAMLEAYKE